MKRLFVFLMLGFPMLVSGSNQGTEWSAVNVGRCEWLYIVFLGPTEHTKKGEQSNKTTEPTTFLVEVTVNRGKLGSKTYRADCQPLYSSCVGDLGFPLVGATYVRAARYALKCESGCEAGAPTMLYEVDLYKGNENDDYMREHVAAVNACGATVGIVDKYGRPATSR